MDRHLGVLPSGEFSVNALVLSLGAMVDNVLGIIGQEGLFVEKTPRFAILPKGGAFEPSSRSTFFSRSG